MQFYYQPGSTVWFTRPYCTRCIYLHMAKTDALHGKIETRGNKSHKEIKAFIKWSSDRKVKYLPT